MAEKCIPELAAQYMKNIGSLEEIRSYAIREMANFLLSVKHECSHRNILRVAGNFVIDQFAQDPVTPNKRGLLTSDFAKITTKIRYKKNNRYVAVANLVLALCCGMFGLSPSKFSWIIFTKTTSRWGHDFDETLVELARKDPTSRFYNKIKHIDEDTAMFHEATASSQLTVDAATKDVRAVAEFIYSSGDVFDKKWKDDAVTETENGIPTKSLAPEIGAGAPINPNITPA
jgi:hypothetical protein